MAQTFIGDQAIVGVQGSVRPDDFEKPQPDVYLLRPKPDDYASSHAGPSDVLLIIEMADSSIEFDQTIKARPYAETGVTKYRIADVRNDRLLAFSEIRDNSYMSRRALNRSETIASGLLSECQFTVDFLLP